MGMCGADPEMVLRFILTDVPDLHDQAIQDGLVTLSSTLTCAHWSLGGPLSVTCTRPSGLNPCR